MSSIKALQDYIFTSKYARWTHEKNRRETYGEAVDRVRDMMLVKYQDMDVEDEIQVAYDAMRKKRILGSQRALQFGGEPILKKNARIFNCCYSHCDRPRFFQEYLWLLLCGCGAGFSVQKHHVAKLPDFRFKRSDIIEQFRDDFELLDHSFQNGEFHYIIPDTIEGWADALGILICASGAGMSITANKIKGIRAVNIFDEKSARQAKEYNHANIIPLGALWLKTDRAKKIIQIFLDSQINQDKRHLRRIKKIYQLER